MPPPTTTRPAITTLLAWLLPLFAWAALAYPGYIELHSGFRPIFNLAELSQKLPGFGWAPSVGQPFDLLRGEGSLAYGLALLPVLLGLAPAAAIKCVFAAGFIFGSAGVYCWARRWLGDWPALLASQVYALWPVTLATVYVRGALAEAVFLGWMPWVLCAAWPEVDADDTAAAQSAPRPLKRLRGLRVSVVYGIALALTFWIQAGLALWLAITILTYEVVSCIAAGGRLRSLLRSRVLPGWLLGVSLGLGGLLPILLRHGPAGASHVSFADHFVYLNQLLQSGGGVGPSIAGPYDGLTFQLGLVACGLAVIGLVVRRPHAAVTLGGLVSRSPAPPMPGEAPRAAMDSHRTARFSAVLILLLVFLTTSVSAFLWRLAPFLAGTLTYPWQLLLVAAPWLAALAGLGGRVLSDLRGQERSGDREADPPLLFVILIGLTLLGSYSDLAPTRAAGPVPDSPRAIYGQDEIALLDAVVAVSSASQGATGPNETISISARWQALRSLDADYTVFIHVLGPDGQVLGQLDTMPQDNKLPTSQWRPGQTVVDVYRVALRSATPAGSEHDSRYRVNLGLYRWQTGQRLRTADDDKVVLTP